MGFCSLPDGFGFRPKSNDTRKKVCLEDWSYGAVILWIHAETKPMGLVSCARLGLTSVGLDSISETDDGSTHGGCKAGFRAPDAVGSAVVGRVLLLGGNRVRIRRRGVGQRMR